MREDAHGVAQDTDDGRLDLVITTNGGAPVLLKSEAGKTNSWLGLELVGTKTNRDAIGARITWPAGGVRRSRLKTAGGGYLSSHDPREIDVPPFSAHLVYTASHRRFALI